MSTGSLGDDRRDWPRAVRVDPALPVLAAAAVVAVGWALVIGIDLLNLGGIGDALHRPAWDHLFNNRPVEWSQWLILAVTIPLYGYIAGRLSGDDRPGAAAFFALFGVGLGLMFIEEAGAVRHAISGYASRHLGPLFGLPPRLYVDLPYFALLAALPLYAVVRYGRYVWRAPRARRYLVAGVVLYGVAAIASGLRHLGDLYVRMGRWIDETLMAGAWPVRPGQSQDRAHFFVIDGAVEESVELFAAASVLAIALAFVWELRRGGVAPELPTTDAPARARTSAPD